jgi:hypothetical protein
MKGAGELKGKGARGVRTQRVLGSLVALLRSYRFILPTLEFASQGSAVS